MLHGSRRRRLDLALPAAAPANARSETIRLRAAPAARTPAAPSDTAASSSPPADSTSARSRGRLCDRLADLDRAFAVVRQLLARRAVRVASADGWVEFALHDVGETGRLYGFACSLATLVDPQGRVELRPRWDTEDWLAADLALALRVRPLRTAWILLRARRARASHPASPGRVAGSIPGDIVAA